MKKLTARQKGFTLIELLVVIGILAILFAIVLIAINPSRQFGQANNTKRRSDTLQILNTIHQYAAEHTGQFPAALVAADTDTVYYLENTGTNSPTLDICDDILGTYIPAIPSDPETSDGAPVTDCTTFETGYTIMKDSAGRITVAAPGADLDQTIEVTR